MVPFASVRRARCRTAWILLILGVLCVGVGACLPAAGTRSDRGESRPDSRHNIVTPYLPPGGQSLGDSDPLRNDRAAFGRLNLVIRWPERVEPYRTSTLPTTTNALYVVVSGALGTVASRVVSRPAGEATSSVTFTLREQNNLGVTIKAYRDLQVDGSNLATATVVATGTAAAINIIRSQDTYLKIVLDALFKPAVSSLSANVGKVGDTIRLNGTNLGLSANSTISVSFGGTKALTVVPVNATSVDVVIPAGATVGKVAIVNDNVASINDPTFWVIGALAIDAPREAWDNGPATGRMVFYGKALSFTATPTWVLAGGKVIGDYGPAPAVSWTSGDALAGTIDPGTGKFQSISTHATSSVKAQLGSLVSNALTVDTRGVDSVSISPGSLTLNAMPPGVQNPDAIFAASTSATLLATVQTTLPYNNGVTWSSGDLQLAAVATSGVVTAGRDAPKGVVTITAKAVDDPNKTATRSVSISILGNLNVAIQ